MLYFQKAEKKIKVLRKLNKRMSNSSFNTSSNTNYTSLINPTGNTLDKWNISWTFLFFSSAAVIIALLLLVILIIIIRKCSKKVDYVVIPEKNDSLKVMWYLPERV